MLVAYASKTGNVKRFVEHLGLRTVRIEETDEINEPFVLVTYTSGFGQVPQNVINFLQRNHQYLRGVSSSGNRNWASFAKAADIVSRLFGVPIISKFENDGTPSDREHFKKEVLCFEAY